MDYFNEILRQIIFWTEISKEHPIVINTVADLTQKNLPQELKNNVMSFNERFEQIQNEARQLLGDVLNDNATMNGVFMDKVLDLIVDFLMTDRDWINTLGEVETYGKEDQVWQTLIGHITEEQVYAAQLFSAYRQYLEEMISS